MGMCGILTATDLTSVLYRYMSIELHMAILTTAIDGTLDKGVFADGDFGLGGQGQCLNICHVGIIHAISNVLLRVECHGRCGQNLCRMFGVCVAFVWQGSLAGTEDVSCERRHRHVVRTDLGMAFDVDRTPSQVLFNQCHRHSADNLILAYRGKRTAAIDAAAHLGVARDGDNTVATHQSRVTMGVDASSGSEHVTLDFGFACSSASSSESYRYRRIEFYAGYLTATVDGTVYRAVTDVDMCALLGKFVFTVITAGIHIDGADHGFITVEVVGNTSAAAIHITADGDAFGSFCYGYIAGAIVLGTDVDEGVTRDVGQMAAAVHIARDVGTADII